MIVTAATVLAVMLIAGRRRPFMRRLTPAPAATDGHLRITHRRRLAGSIAGSIAVSVAAFARRRPSNVGPADVAEWCEALARSVRSGTSLHESVTSTAPNTPAMTDHLDPYRHRLARGDTLIDAVRPSQPPAGHDLRLALDVIGICSAVGGSAAAALDRTAVALRQRAADRSERRSQAAQARLSAHVLTVVPLAMLGLLLIVDVDVRTAVATPIGAAVVAGGLALNAAGWLWMRAVVERSTR